MTYEKVTKYHDVNYCPVCGGETTAGFTTPYIFEGEAVVDCTVCLRTLYWSFGFFDLEDCESFKGVYYHF